MNINTYNSDSTVQQNIGKIMIQVYELETGMSFQIDPRISIGNSTIVPDFYSEEKKIIGEVYAHIGKPNVGQINKLSRDILKMILYSNSKDYEVKKVMLVCDTEIEKYLRESSSWLSECIRRFNIEVKRIKLSDDQREEILSAQKRQRMVNA